MSTPPVERAVPPVTELGMASLALIIAGGIYLAAHLPQQVSLTPAVALLAASTVLLAINLALLGRRIRGAALTRRARLSGFAGQGAAPPRGTLRPRPTRARCAWRPRRHG